MISGLVLKYLNGECFVICGFYKYTLLASTEFNLTVPAPAQTYHNIRLDRARTLLMETDLSVIEIAMATGFNSNGVFSRHYKERYGESPYGNRRDVHVKDD